MTNILITGGNGQLGQAIKKIAPEYEQLNIIYSDIDELDICNVDSLIQYTKNRPINYLVNCAAYTAVDKAEHEKTLAKQINADAVKNIAIASKENNFRVIHISTDYVFDGKSFKPYKETDRTIPESNYGQTKLLGEKYLLDNNQDSLIIRTSWLYSEFGNNFVKTMIKLGKDKPELNVVADQIGSPTYAVDLANTILTIIHKIEFKGQKYLPGIYHYSNEGVCSWYDFAVNIHQMMGIEYKISPLETKDYPTAAPRPPYSVLNKSKIKNNYKIEIPYWMSSLEQCLIHLKNN